MKTFPVGQFKSHFSDILEDIKNGEEVAISFGKKKEKIAVLIPYSKYKKSHKRKLGILENKASFNIKNDYKITEDEFLTS
jgi:antitoxin (DNA-binding transcriptional repressor) of toxin-antitoxin stability system